MGWVRRRGRKVNGRERKYRAERKGLGKENGKRGKKEKKEEKERRKKKTKEEEKKKEKRKR